MTTQNVRDLIESAKDELKIGGDPEKAKVYAELAKAAAVSQVAVAIERHR